MEYTYQCTECDSVFTINKSILAPHPKKCPKCGGKVEHLIDVPNIVYEGGGWANRHNVPGAPVPGYDVDEVTGKPIRPPD
jgi:putative FmdB family regulatory protein